MPHMGVSDLLAFKLWKSGMLSDDDCRACIQFALGTGAAEWLVAPAHQPVKNAPLDWRGLFTE